MTADSFLALLGLAAAASWTLGPNNAMLAASGVNFGLRRTVPHIAGVVLGFALMLFVVALGLGEVFERLPELKIALRWLGAAALLWFAWRIANASNPGGSAGGARPIGFLEAAGFQWLNPKGWAMCLAVISQFAGQGNAAA
ncbi:MAG TPA: LysE family translocator, partial [Paracoccaceae bacterium]|nr:LysE family translocator [Paracoccaceae bacterium]